MAVAMTTTTSAAPRSTGYITQRGLHRTRCDSRTGYLPQIDIPSLDLKGAPKHLYDQLPGNMTGRYTKPLLSSPLASTRRHKPLQTARLARNQDVFWRAGNKLDEWHCGDINKFKCVLQPGGGTMAHPGLLLPEMLSTSQGLYGPCPDTSGTPRSLRSIALSLPHQVPRFMTHDSTSMSASTNAHFRKTAITFNPDNLGNKDQCSEYVGRFPRPPSGSRRQSNFGSCGSPMNIFGRSGVALVSGSGRCGM